MKIFFSTDAIPKRLGYQLNLKGGFGHAHQCIKNQLIAKGIEAVDDPHEADIEFLCAPPQSKLKPDMHPSSIMTMWESTRLPSFFIPIINRYDHICNPSKWGKETFERNGISQPIDIVPLGVDNDKFHYLNRYVATKGHPWTFFIQSVQLLDRKNAFKCLQLFVSDKSTKSKLPSDTRLIIKTIPFPITTGTQIDLWITPQVHFIEKPLEWDELIDLHKDCHISVNPTSGEGFGLIPMETMATGMATIVTNYSGITEWADAEYVMLLDYIEIPTHFDVCSYWAKPNMDQCLKYMLWTYEHQDEALALGQRASSWVRSTWTYDKTAEKLIAVFERLIKTIPKRVSAWKPTDPIEEWFRIDRLFGKAPMATGN